MGDMQQLTLFEPLIVHVKTGQVIPANTVAVEEIDHPDLKRLPKGKYKLHSTGGFHFFKDVENAPQIYKEQVWPWLEVIKENKRTTKVYALIPRIMPSKGFYAQVTLLGDGFNIKITMHKLVCLAFNKNPDPKTHLVVNHINGLKVDYRPHNLEWSTHEANSTGPTLESRLPADIVYKMYKLSLNEKETEENEIIEINNDN
jgi:hypothetical protein